MIYKQEEKTNGAFNRYAGIIFSPPHIFSLTRFFDDSHLFINTATHYAQVTSTSEILLCTIYIGISCRRKIHSLSPVKHP